MGKDRLAAFSDGVIAIIITIMVLELKVPHGADWAALRSLAPDFVSYVLSFVYLGIYWNNHHHLLHAVTRVDGRSCGPTCICCSGCRWSRSAPAGWARIISRPCRPRSTASILLDAGHRLLPAAEGDRASAGPAFRAGERARQRFQRQDIGRCSMPRPSRLPSSDAWLSIAIYALVAVMWLIPDRRIEKVLREG